ncbi:MAG: hypothetical protein NTY20_05970 [Candidatus Aenigmarchaeota archaeon]|nr:hypothetical protein [Candidatus Aenigmarchaeota archaeon]
MPIIGMKFDSMEAKREKMVDKGEIKVNSTPRITSAKLITLPSINKKALALNFDFVTTYSPDIGKVKISGELLYMSEENAKILKQWQTKKTLPEATNIEVLNHLFRQCLLKVANIADDLQLPPPLAIPRVAPKQKEAGYVG